MSELANDWRQVNIHAASWQAVERVGVHHVGPALRAAEDAGLLHAWWFVRKAVSWRIRMLPAESEAFLPDTLSPLLHQLREQNLINSHVEVIYEPEVHAFGGPDAMDIAHRLFHHDSRHLLAHLASTAAELRHELALLLGTRMLRAAGLEWYEQGDVWAQVAAHRPPAAATASPKTVRAIQRLVTADSDVAGSPLHEAPGWPQAFADTGRALSDLHHAGLLRRGLRAVLAHHVLFSWNRLGIPAALQHLLASTVRHIVFEYRHTPTPWRDATGQRPNPDKVTTMTADTHTVSPQHLRNALADIIRDRGTFRSAAVEEAFRTVPRELFLPGTPIEEAYAPRPVVTRRADDGTAISSASSPNLVAQMLEQANLRPGQRVLEIGTATGINAALARELVGDNGEIVTIEYDPDLAAGARDALQRAGYADVTVIAGDGAAGDPEHAPYDRIIVTAGAWDIADAWWRQLAPDGRIIVPLRLHESGLTRSFAFDHTASGVLRSTTEPLVCGFVPMRGSAEHDDHHIALDTDVILKLDPTDCPDRDALARCLTFPREELWTGIEVGDFDPIGHLDLWIFTHTRRPFARLGVGAAARNSGLVTPAYRWAGAALHGNGTIAYLAFRERGNDVQELGVVMHGPDSAKLGPELTHLLHTWNDAGRPNLPTVTARHTAQAAAPGRIVRPNTLIDIEF